MARASATRTPQPSSTRRFSRRVAALVTSETGEVSTPTSRAANGKSVVNGATNGTPASAFKTPLTSTKKSGHIKFDDDNAGGGGGGGSSDEEYGVNGVPDTPRTGYVTAEEDFSDSSEHENAESDDDDDDEAPEDVSFQGGRQAAIVQAQERKREVEILRDEQRAKRKANDARLRAQKEAKKAKSAENDADQSAKRDELPLFLPSSILKEVTTTPHIGIINHDDDEASKKPKRKKIIFSEPDARDIPKGDITLRVLRTQKLKTMPPPAKTKPLKSREKWLNRKRVRDAKAGHKIVI
ncbi:hypothetical protein V1506DRAFT_531745 [Lipomyces tetrasporus]